MRAPQLAIGSRLVVTLYKKYLVATSKNIIEGARQVGPYWGLYPVAQKLLGIGPQRPQSGGYAPG